MMPLPPSDGPDAQSDLRRARAAGGVRMAAWAVVAAACWYSVGHSAPHAWQAAIAPVLAGAIVALLPRLWRGSPLLRLATLAAGLAGATVVTAQTGGIRSPLTPVYALVVMDGQQAFGGVGALVVASLAAALSAHGGSPAATFPEIAIHAAFAAALILSAGLLALTWPVAKRPTLLDQRRAEDLEQRLAQAEEARRVLRASYDEAGAAARTSRRRERDAVAAADIIAACAGECEPQAGLEQALDVLRTAFESAGAALWLMAPDSPRLCISAVAGRVAPLISADPVEVPDGALPASIRRVCEMRLRAASPVANTPGTEQAEGDDGVIGSVLREGERVMGAVAIAANSGASYGPADRERLVGIARALSRGAQIARERKEAARAVDLSRKLLDVAHAARAAANREDLCEALADAAMRLVPAGNCTVFLLDAAGDALTPAATRGEVINLIRHIPFERGTGVSAWVAQERKVILIADLARETALRSMEMLPPRVRSFASVPLIDSRGAAIGAINVSHADANVFGKEDVRALEALAAEVTTALSSRPA